MRHLECSSCGITPGDLPDGFANDDMFDWDEVTKTWKCLGCLNG